MVGPGQIKVPLEVSVIQTQLLEQVVEPTKLCVSLEDVLDPGMLMMLLGFQHYKQHRDSLVKAAVVS